MNHVARDLDIHDPCLELASRWPGWQINPRQLDGIPEVWSASRRMVLIDQGWYDRDPALAMAHALAHLDLGHHLRMPLSAQDEADADGLAMVRLDRVPGWWPGVDGEPTEPLLGEWT